MMMRKHLVILCIVIIFTFNYNNNNNVHGASLLLQNKQQKTIDSNNNNNNNAIIPKRPADQDEYEAYMSGEKKLVTSFQVTPVVATNTECIKKNTNCQWRELGIHERSSGFIMLRNNNNMKDPSHQFGISCIICGTDTLCSDPDEHAMKTTIDMNSKDGTVQHQIRMDKLVEQVTKKCKTVMPERKLSMKHLRTIHQGLGSLMGMPESVGAGMIGANVGASDMLEDDRFGSLEEEKSKIIEGTKALSPTRLNGLVIGKDVNNGDVKNTKKYVNANTLNKEMQALVKEEEGEEDTDDGNDDGEDDQEEDDDDDATGAATGPESDDDDNDQDDDDDDASGADDDDDDDATGPDATGPEDGEEEEGEEEGGDDDQDDEKNDASSSGATGPEKKAANSNKNANRNSNTQVVASKKSITKRAVDSKGKQAAKRIGNKKSPVATTNKKSKVNGKKVQLQNKKSLNRPKKKGSRKKGGRRSWWERLKKRFRRKRKGNTNKKKNKKKRGKGGKGGKGSRRRRRRMRKKGKRYKKCGKRCRRRFRKLRKRRKRKQSFLELGKQILQRRQEQQPGPNKKDNNDNKDDGPNALNLQQFKLNAALANGLCSIEGESPALLLKNVFMDKNNQFQFSCLDNKGLCDCISKISKSKEDITITDSKFTFKLIGTGDSCKYELIDNTKGGSSNTTQRRRLLQRGSGGIC